jgi:putative heme-binding domain-containing protein
MQCHRFDGKGHEVGPQLDGAERSIDYLLINILDPNRVVGAPYYTRTILLKNGKLLTGLAAGEDDQTVTLKRENAALEIVQKKDIDEQKTEAKSLMPEGLDKNITPPEFRDLIRYLMANPYITEVVVSDPFRGDKAFDQTLPPEQSDPLKAEGTKWKRQEAGPAGRLVLHTDQPAVQYVYAEVIAPAAMKTRLLVGANGPVKAWLNGKPVLTGATGPKDEAPDRHSAEVSLEPGVNRLLFKIATASPATVLYARLHDPDRKLKYQAAGR